MARVEYERYFATGFTDARSDLLHDDGARREYFDALLRLAVVNVTYINLRH